MRRHSGNVRVVLYATIVTFLLIAAPALAQNNPDTAVWTDKNNYTPGELVTVTGVGFQPGEVVNVVFRVDGREDRTSTADADENGGITNNIFSPDTLDAGATIQLIATGTLSGFEAINYFLDGDTLPSCASYAVDAVNGTTGGPTFKTIQAAVAAVPNSGSDVCTIKIKAGTYNESVTISAKRPGALTIKPDSGGVVVSSATQSGNSKKFPFNIQNSQRLTITGLTISGASDSGLSIAGSSEITIAANDVTGDADGIKITGSDLESGIWVYNNIVHGNSGNGIVVGNANSTSYIVNNSVYSNTGRGILISGVRTTSIVNNLIVGSGGWGLQQTGGSATTAVTLKNNMFYNNASGDIDSSVLDSTDSDNYTKSGTGTGIKGCTFTDCGVSHSNTEILNTSGVDAGHLVAGSPAADQGLNSFVVGTERVPTTDMDGDTRPVNNTVDIGADEAPLANPPGVPTITGTKPSDPTKQTSATFTFEKNASDTGTVTFECDLDGTGYQSCESGAASATYTGLMDGQHTFRVRSRNLAGTSQPAEYSWTVDTTGAKITITGKPDELTKSTSATFDFSADDPNATFECKLDSGSFATCSGPKSYASLAEGLHSFTVQTADNAGNTGTASYSWTIDTTAPKLTVTRVTAANSNGWNNTAVDWRISCEDTNGIKDITASGAATGTSGTSPLNVTVSGEGANMSVSAQCTDSAGNGASDSISGINIDTTKPVIIGNRTPEANTNGWNNTDVTVKFSCAESGTVQSGIDQNTVGGDNILSTEGKDQSVSSTGSCTDKAGNVAEAAKVSGISIDKTKPTITLASRLPEANANGWNNTNVTASYTASDALSGLDGLDKGSYEFTTEGAGQSHTFEVTDKAGNRASIEVKDVNIDKTAPSVSATPSPGANANGWNNVDVTVTFKGTDSLSDIDKCDEPTVLSSERAGQSATGKCTDKAGNSASATASGINIDKTAPTITLASRLPVANTYGWNNTDVTVTWTCSDALSLPVSPSAAQTVSSEGPDQTAKGVCTDKAGNSVSDTVSNISVDKTNPTLSPTITPNPPILNGAATATDGAIDSLSGIATHSCTQPDTSSVGSKTLTCTATDKAGNSLSQVVSYSVTYLSGGVCLGDAGHTILQPINADGNSVFKQKSTVPAKFRVCDATGASIGAAGVVTAFRLVGTGLGTVSEVDEAVVSTTPDTIFRWDPTALQWIFNMSTKNLSPGMTYVYRISLNDGTPIDFRFGLK